MKKFKFKLEGILKIKESMEKEVRNELISIQSLCSSQQEKIQSSIKKAEDWSLYYSAVMKKRCSCHAFGNCRSAYTR
ncbi:hypothetical protein BVY03_00410, partial [bacterium K02(2017)]